MLNVVQLSSCRSCSKKSTLSINYSVVESQPNSSHRRTQLAPKLRRCRSTGGVCARRLRRSASPCPGLIFSNVFARPMRVCTVADSVRRTRPKRGLFRPKRNTHIWVRTKKSSKIATTNQRANEKQVFNGLVGRIAAQKDFQVFFFLLPLLRPLCLSF